MSVVGNMIAKFGRAVIVNRRAPGDYDGDGEWVEGALTVVPMTMSIQPSTGRDRQLMPEGVRTENIKKVYSEAALQGDDEDSKTIADIIVDGALKYKVVIVETNDANFLNHHRIFAQLITEST